MARDFLFSLRALRRRPGFSILVIAVLALGMGANAALFSIIDRVLLHPFNYREPDRLVEISGRDFKNRPSGVSPAAFDFWQPRVPAFEHSALWRWRDLMLTGVDDPEDLFTLQVSRYAFDILGVLPRHGRLFRPHDFQKGSPPVALLSYRTWQRHFRGDPAILGRQILLDQQGYTVIGIMGPQFMFNTSGVDLWTPLNPFQKVEEELSHGYSAMARLRPGATLEQAQRQSDAATPQLPKSAKERPGWHAVLQPYADQYVGEYRRAFYVLWGAVLLVMLIACANAANLLLAQASRRRREFGVRASLGAGRIALLRQVLTESLLLGAAAGLLGLGLAELLFRALVIAFPENATFIRPEKLALTPSALLVTLAAVLATTVLAAVPSCWDVWGQNLGLALHSGSRSASADRASNRTRSLLVAFEVALSATLLIGAGVMLHSLFRLLQVPMGFRPDHVLTARVAAPVQLKGNDPIAAYYDRVLHQVDTIPGVRSAAVVTILPMGNLVATTSLTVEGRPDSGVDPEWRSYGIRFRSVTPKYFETMRVRILKGRAFTHQDTGKSPPVVIVNDDLARHYWPGQDPIGKRVSRYDDPKPDQWVTVVGVIESAQDGSPHRNPGAEVYRPLAQETLGARATSVVLRTNGDPLTIATALRKRIHAINPDQPVSQVQTMESWVRQAIAQPRFNTFLLELFAALAFVLAISGVFAVVSYAVALRTNEIGIRSALGATAGDIVRFVVRLGLRPVLAGVAIGAVAAVAGTRLLKSQLFETSPLDPAVFGAVLALLVAAAIAAALVPARRAARIDPAVTLRSE